MKELAARRATECAALCHTHSRLSCRFASSLTASSAGIKAKPYKLGRLNRETEYVLQALGLEAPDDLFALEPGTPVAIVDTNNPQELPAEVSDVSHDMTPSSGGAPVDVSDISHGMARPEVPIEVSES